MNKIQMTKEIAFDYLKGKKVKMDIRPIAVQTLVQKIGFHWNLNDDKIKIKDVFGICLGQDGLIRYCDWEKTQEWNGYMWDEIDPQQILAIELVD